MKKHLSKILFLFVIISLTPACYGPPKLEKFKNIEPNETAFLIPLDQGKTS